MTPRELLVPSELRQLRSQLSDALEASDGAISDEFDSRTRNEIRAEIARKSAALIHQARHGNWNAAALREALASWRLLKRLEENARPGGASSRSIGDGSTDFIWRRGERIFAVEVKSAPSGLTNIMAGFDPVAELAGALQVTFLRLSPGEAVHGDLSFAPPSMGGPCQYNPIFFGDYLSIRDEWRAITSVLDRLSLGEEELSDLGLLRKLTELIKQQFDLRGRICIRYTVRRYAREFAPTLYELVRSYVLITCLCPPVAASNAIAMRMDRLGFRRTNDLYKRRARRGAKARRMAVRGASRRRPRSAGRGSRSRRCGGARRYSLCGPAHPSCHRKTKAPLLRRRWKHVLDLLRVACP